MRKRCDWINKNSKFRGFCDIEREWSLFEQKIYRINTNHIHQLFLDRTYINILFKKSIIVYYERVDTNGYLLQSPKKKKKKLKILSVANIYISISKFMCDQKSDARQYTPLFRDVQVLCRKSYAYNLNPRSLFRKLRFINLIEYWMIVLASCVCVDVWVGVCVDVCISVVFVLEFVYMLLIVFVLEFMLGLVLVVAFV